MFVSSREKREGRRGRKKDTRRKGTEEALDLGVLDRLYFY